LTGRVAHHLTADQADENEWPLNRSVDPSLSVATDQHSGNKRCGFINQQLFMMEQDGIHQKDAPRALKIK
jgi:hypothetical protein